MAVKKSTGTVRKQLYGMPQYREDQQRRGPTLPERDVMPQLPQAQPYVAPGKAYKEVVEQQAIQHQVKTASKLLGKASRIKTGPRAIKLHKQLAAVALPMEKSYRNRAAIEVAAPKKSAPHVNQSHKQLAAVAPQMEQPMKQSVHSRPVVEVEHREIVQVLREPRREHKPAQPRQKKSDLLRKKAILNCHRLVNHPDFQVPIITDPRILKLMELKNFWLKSKNKLSRDNAAAVIWSNAVRLKIPSEFSNRQYLANKQKQQLSLKVVNEMEKVILSAFQAGDVDRTEDALFNALEHIFQDVYVCDGKFLWTF